MRAEELRYDADGFVDMSHVDEAEDAGSDQELQELLRRSPEVDHTRWSELVDGAVDPDLAPVDDDLVPGDLADPDGWAGAEPETELDWEEADATPDAEDWDPGGVDEDPDTDDPDDEAGDGDADDDDDDA
jgi:hypothetical protein